MKSRQKDRKEVLIGQKKEQTVMIWRIDIIIWQVIAEFFATIAVFYLDLAYAFEHLAAAVILMQLFIAFASHVEG